MTRFFPGRNIFSEKIFLIRSFFPIPRACGTKGFKTEFPENALGFGEFREIGGRRFDFGNRSRDGMAGRSGKTRRIGKIGKIAASDPAGPDSGGFRKGTGGGTESPGLEKPPRPLGESRGRSVMTI
jgi:hypothetical protein